LVNTVVALTTTQFVLLGEIPEMQLFTFLIFLLSAKQTP